MPSLMIDLKTVGGLQDLGEPAVKELLVKQLAPFLNETDRDKLVHGTWWRACESQSWQCF